MAVSLTKGGNVSLEKVAPGMRNVMVGLGWNPRTTTGEPFDLDASCLLLGAGGKVESEADFVFYNNARGDGGSVCHLGDNRTGDGEGDDESISVDLTNLRPSIDRIVFVVSIDQATQRGQNFGMVSESFIRLYDADDPSNMEKGARFDLGEDAATETALVFGELYRHSAEWKFRAIGQGYANGLSSVITEFGVNVG